MASLITGVSSEAQDQANRLGNPLVQTLPQPASYSGTPITYLASDIIGSIIVHNTGATASTGNLPSAANLIAAIPGGQGGRCRVGDTVECLITNTGSTGNLTIALGSGGSFDSNQSSAAIAAGTSKVLAFRVTNPTPGSEAFTVYC
ncbi:MAG TPA: hypothetical protein VGJ20_28845 [Xanthobacteraceae bacterium]|jgi:hypothetical protein